MLGTKIMKIGVGHMIGKIEAITEGTIEALVIVGLGQVQEQVKIEIGLDVSSAGEYDHFARDFPMTQDDREVEQIQQMFNMDEDQTILQMPIMDIDQVRQSVSPTEAKEN